MFEPRPFRRTPWRRSVRPNLELLEDRCVPATITVTSAGDDTAVDGTVSLREAILSINQGANFNKDVVAVGAYGTNDTIDFAAGLSGQTITINSALPTITKGVTITGPGPANLTVKANLGTSSLFRVFTTNSSSL